MFSIAWVDVTRDMPKLLHKIVEPSNFLYAFDHKIELKSKNTTFFLASEFIF